MSPLGDAVHSQARGRVMEWFGFWIFFTVALLFFTGEPDLREALVHYLMKGNGS